MNKDLLYKYKRSRYRLERRGVRLLKQCFETYWSLSRRKRYEYSIVFGITVLPSGHKTKIGVPEFMGYYSWEEVNWRGRTPLEELVEVLSLDWRSFIWSYYESLGRFSNCNLNLLLGWKNRMFRQHLIKTSVKTEWDSVGERVSLWSWWVPKRLKRKGEIL